MQDIRYSCSALPTMNGHTLRGLKPDENGAYDVVIGGIGIPTRNNVIYDTNSLLAAMSDPTARFSICLKDGNLAGEYGHPNIASQDDLSRLMEIREKNISHYFTKIWTGDPVTIGGMTGKLLCAKVVPTGPYGETLRKQLEDPHHNTAFSIRSLCLPMTGPDNRYEYRKVQVVVTFDAVFAPGFEVATKRYVRGNESFQEYRVNERSLMKIAETPRDQESTLMIGRDDVLRIFGSDTIYRCNQMEYRKSNYGKNQLFREDGKRVPAADLLYRR